MCIVVHQALMDDVRLMKRNSDIIVAFFIKFYGDVNDSRDVDDSSCDCAGAQC